MIGYNDLKIKVIKLVGFYIVLMLCFTIIGTLYYNYMTIKESVKKMTENETKDLITLFKHIDDGFSDKSVRKLEYEIVKKLRENHLNYIKFYRTSLKGVNRVNSLDKKGVFHLDINNLLKGENQSILDIGLNRISLETILPIKDSLNKKVIGYLAVRYDVPKEKLKKIKSSIFLTLFLVVFGTIIISLILVPIIFKLNSSLIDYAKQLIDSRVQTIMVLGKAISKRDTDTGLHNYRVTLYSIGLNIKKMQDLIKGSFLHDIGKIAIRDHILLKAEKLDINEFEEMKKHVKYGVEIIEELQWLGNAKDVVRYHHERYDGKGYMEGLKGEEIPVNAMIFTVADVFDALTSKRPYKEPFSYEKSMEIMTKERGKHFNPEIFDAFSDISKKLYDEIYTVKDENELKRLLIIKIAKYGYYEFNTKKG